MGVVPSVLIVVIPCDGLVVGARVSFPMDLSAIPVVASSSKIVQCNRARRAEGGRWCGRLSRCCLLLLLCLKMSSLQDSNDASATYTNSYCP